MAFYENHIFFCHNQRNNGKACCADHQAFEHRAYMKTRLKQLGLHGASKNRVNLAGCMGRCTIGPVIVIYPEGVWYTYRNFEDIDEIIESHIIGGKLVSRLILPGSERVEVE